MGAANCTTAERIPASNATCGTTPRIARARDRLLFGLLSWYGDMSDLHGLVARSHRGGPIARRAVAHVKQASGLDAEERLNRICREVDAPF
jgi:hypothetical protein